MSENLKFDYKKEFWFISAFINSKKIDINDKIKEINEIVYKKAQNLSKDDLKKIAWNPKWVKEIIEMCKNITVDCEWVDLIENFIYYNEDLNLKFDTLGYIRFNVEYYKDKPEKKKQIEPMYLQQLPVIILNKLRDYCNKYINQYFCIDTESPIFIMASSDNMNLDSIWNKENIIRYKKEIGNWTEIYSGHWEDYSEELYSTRISDNLSNRLSELHFIKRNSGFIYMKKENYETHFDDYIIKRVLEPTALVRSMVFSIIAINKSLDVLFRRQHSEAFNNIELIEIKIKNLKYLRGLIQTQLSIIYDELDYNRRQHYTKVLTHLLKEFHLNNMIERITKKFDLIYESMQILYQKKNDESQIKQERGVRLLQLFFGLGSVISLINAIKGIIEDIHSVDPLGFVFNLIITLLISTVFLIVFVYFAKINIEKKRENIINAVDSVIVDSDENIVLIKRKNPPYKGQLALPGGMIEKGESAESAIVREVKEETSLDIKIVKKVGVYDQKLRDPRGRVISTAFLCKIDGDTSKMKAKDDAVSIDLIPIKTLKGIDLAFDHEHILNDAIEFE